VQHQNRLLLGALHRHKPHVGALNRLADRLRIGRIVLVALEVGLNILRRHQAHLVPQDLQFASPIMSRSTGFQADPARRQLSEEHHHFATPQLLAHNRGARRVDPMNLENPLG
jgi:hypothetical protein